jgi:hypothetical protein
MSEGEEADWACPDLAPRQETEADMEDALFCMCAPGQTQDTVRMWRAIVKGCIPVTLFRANDLPFARFLVGGHPFACMPFS